MNIGLLYWILMVLWFVLGLYGNRTKLANGEFGGMGGDLLLFVLLFLLGWRSFGFIIHN